MLFACLTTPLTTSAAEIDQSTPAAEELASSRYPIYIAPITLDSVYKQLYADRQNGINANIKVCSNGTSPIDIKMTDVNENVVWEGSKAIGSNSYRTFWCGEDVAKVYARTSANCQCNAYM